MRPRGYLSINLDEILLLHQLMLWRTLGLSLLGQHTSLGTERHVRHLAAPRLGALFLILESAILLLLVQVNGWFFHSRRLVGFLLHIGFVLLG